MSILHCIEATFQIKNAFNHWRHRADYVTQEAGQILPVLEDERTYYCAVTKRYRIASSEYDIPCDDLGMEIGVDVTVPVTSGSFSRDGYYHKKKSDCFDIAVIIYTRNDALRDFMKEQKDKHLKWCFNEEVDLEIAGIETEIEDWITIDKTTFTTKFKRPLPTGENDTYEWRCKKVLEFIQGLSKKQLEYLRNQAYLIFIRRFQLLRRCSVCHMQVQTTPRCHKCAVNAKRKRNTTI